MMVSQRWMKRCRGVENCWTEWTGDSKGSTAEEGKKAEKKQVRCADYCTARI